jgi:hypothetical protein
MTAPKQADAADYMPPSLKDLVTLIGFPATLKLVERYGGLPLYVPREEHLNADHGIVATIGADLARKLSRDRGTETLEIPRAAGYLRWVRDQVMRRQYETRSASELAREFGMTRRNVFYRVGTDEDDDQGDLFGR